MPKLPSRVPRRSPDSSALMGSPLLGAIPTEDLQALVKVARADLGPWAGARPAQRSRGRHICTRLGPGTHRP